jgi:signal transduction histidine kinase
MLTVAKSRTRRAPASRSLARTSVAHKRETAVESTESLRMIAHDARNLMTAIGLCCDLLAEPGVLSEGYRDFATELRAVALASSGLVEKLTASCEAGQPDRPAPARMVKLPIDDLAASVQQLRGPLKAIAGAKISLEMECLRCFGRVRLSQEDLARILMNFTRNAAEAMPQGGRIRITVQQGDGGSFLGTAYPARSVLLSVQDSGSGIQREKMGRIFEAGFSTKKRGGVYRGLGLSIVRKLVEEAGGSVRAISVPGGGTRLEVELPLIHQAGEHSGFMADFPERANIEC